MPTYTLGSHPGVLIVDPVITPVMVSVNLIDKTFSPELHFVVEPNINISHTMPPQTCGEDCDWDKDIMEAKIQTYIQTLEV